MSYPHRLWMQCNVQNLNIAMENDFLSKKILSNIRFSCSHGVVFQTWYASQKCSGNFFKFFSHFFHIIRHNSGGHMTISRQTRLKWALCFQMMSCCPKQDFTRNTTHTRKTNQWKHLHVAIILGQNLRKYCFYFTKIIQKICTLVSIFS